MNEVKKTVEEITQDLIFEMSSTLEQLKNGQSLTHNEQIKLVESVTSKLYEIDDEYKGIRMAIEKLHNVI